MKREQAEGASAAEEQPAKKKPAVVAGPHKLRYAVSHDQGPRQTMEDAHTALTQDHVAFFCICDGHGGANVARMVAERLHGHALAAGLKQARTDSETASCTIAYAFRQSGSGNKPGTGRIPLC